MGKFFNSPKSIGIAVLRLENDGCVKGGDEPTLSGNTKLGWKICMNTGDGMQNKGIGIFGCMIHGKYLVEKNFD